MKQTGCVYRRRLCIFTVPGIQAYVMMVFIGIITIHDLMREAMADYEKEKQNLDKYEIEFFKVA